MSGRTIGTRILSIDPGFQFIGAAIFHVPDGRAAKAELLDAATLDILSVCRKEFKGTGRISDAGRLVIIRREVAVFVKANPISPELGTKVVIERPVPHAYDRTTTDSGKDSIAKSIQKLNMAYGVILEALSAAGYGSILEVPSTWNTGKKEQTIGFVVNHFKQFYGDRIPKDHEADAVLMGATFFRQALLGIEIKAGFGSGRQGRPGRRGCIGRGRR